MVGFKQVGDPMYIFLPKYLKRSLYKAHFQSQENWSERRCAGGELQQGYAVTSNFIGIFSSLLSPLSELITQCVVVVVNLPSQAVSNTLTKSDLLRV